MTIPATFTKTTKHLLIRFYNAEDFELWKKTQAQIPTARNKWDIKPDPNFRGTQGAFTKLLHQEAKARKSDRFYFIALNKKSGQPIGQAIFFDIRRQIFQSGGIGYGIYNTFWSQGYGRELVKAMFEIGFDRLKLHRIEACIEVKNIRSIRLAKSVGMVREGVRRGFVFYEEEWKSLVVYSLLSEDLDIPFNLPAPTNRSK